MIRQKGWKAVCPSHNEWIFRLTKMVSRIVLAPFFRLKISGTENLPRNGAFILLSKHQRWEDIPLMGLATPRPLYFIAKYELFINPLSRWYLGSLGGIPLNRQRPLESRRFLHHTIGLLENGSGVVVFPEGTYYRNRIGPGQTGMIRFVLSRMSLPFIPVGINYSKTRRRNLVQIKFGRVCYPSPGVTADKFVQQMMKEIAFLSNLSENEAAVNSARIADL